MMPGKRLASSEPAIILQAGREKSLLRHHPWVFSGAVAQVQGKPESGTTIKILSADGSFLAWGAYSPQSQIRARVWSWDENSVIDEKYFRSKIEAVISSRKKSNIYEKSDSLRLIYAESDDLPGLVVDRYGDWIVIQLLSSGTERWREAIVSSLCDLADPKGIYERSDVEVRRLEGLSERTGIVWGQIPPDYLQIHEHEMVFLVDIYHGHKTGFYLDQRDNRLSVRAFAKGARALDCFSYTGGFSANLLAGGAEEVTAIDSSDESLTIAQKNIETNDLPQERISWMQGDVFQALRKFRDQGRQFDLIVLDPPKFAPTSSQVQKAARGYKDINLLALKLLHPGGTLITFSCSGGVDQALFQKIVAGAALDAGIEAQIIQRLHQASDHPVALNFPEGEYLKGLVIRKS